MGPSGHAGAATVAGGVDSDLDHVQEVGAAPDTRQCGRCREWFAVAAGTGDRPKWWSCPTCHLRLFGPGKHSLATVG
jgi:hypothetical protein